MKKAELLVKPNMELKAKRTINTFKPRPIKPNDWWGIDMTKVMINNFGWIYVVLVLDWYSKKIVGYYAGMQCKSCHWLEALNQAINKQFPNGIEGKQLNLMSDNGCQPTALRFMKSCAAYRINQAFTSYNNPKGNADTERLMRTLKEELAWLTEWQSPTQFNNALENWIKYYNNEYLHSTLKYQTPIHFEENYYQQNFGEKFLLAVA